MLQFPLWYFIPESPRWLITKGKDKEAKVLVQKIINMNGKEVALTLLLFYYILWVEGEGGVTPSNFPPKQTR